jgi:hypothetical protein
MSPTSYQTAPPRGGPVTIAAGRQVAKAQVRDWGDEGRYRPEVRRRRERELRERIERLEQRLDDMEDIAVAALAPDRVDALTEQLEELAVMAPTHDDLLGVRLHTARLAGELSRSVTELRADLARLLESASA